ncbi:hypothetical protein SAMN03080615_02686 [Amphritea atlantica]|uniref:Uncharacterized protein n=1 Tax=Amphritea atlantica TaxID=355243 RepID=A0A1H9INW7_9GAMM|nr:hypothetical protein SAMN03080615_02686 [Amphritea atlantica]
MLFTHKKQRDFSGRVFPDSVMHDSDVMNVALAFANLYDNHYY